MKTKILIVDDDLNICELISLYLDKEGYETIKAHSGNSAITEFNKFNPDLVLLDIMLPEKDGLELCQEIRKTSKAPIIMLTAKGETFDKVLGLSIGADDYIVKPFDAKELVARVKAVLRRTMDSQSNDANSDGQVEFLNLKINPTTYSVIYHESSLDLPPKEFELLYFLAKHKNQVFTRDQLLDKIWGYDFIGDTRTVDVHIKRLREKMTYDDNWGIKTVWGVGYKFDTK